MVKLHQDLGYVPIFIFHKGLGNEGVDSLAGKEVGRVCI